MAKSPKFYTVWKGHAPGVYDNWPDCQRQVLGYPGAQFKSFPSRAAAQEAFAGDYKAYEGKKASPTPTTPSRTAEELQQLGVILDSVCVDAACSGNPGDLEYQGVETAGGQPLFHRGPFPECTVNMGEFLAIVEAAKLLRDQGRDCPVYSDSVTALAWIREKHANTQMPRTDANRPVFELLEQAEQWLATHVIRNPLLKWQTAAWGEIPADFGRK